MYLCMYVLKEKWDYCAETLFSGKIHSPLVQTIMKHAMLIKVNH